MQTPENVITDVCLERPRGFGEFPTLGNCALSLEDTGAKGCASLSASASAFVISQVGMKFGYGPGLPWGLD